MTSASEILNDLAAAFRWTAKLNMHEGVANHFSVCMPNSNDFYVNGVDFLIWNDQQKLTEIRVFIRPFEALNAIKKFMVKYL